MATWIIGIDAQNPQHWDYAKHHGYWDMTRWTSYEPGDILYFWQARASLLGRARVTKGTYELPEGTSMPWNIEDEKRQNYQARVEFETTHATAAAQPSWSELEAATGVRGKTNFGPRRIATDDGERWLAQQVAGVDVLFIDPEAEKLAEEFVQSDDGQAAPSPQELEVDRRIRIEASIVVRRGQGAFRQSLLSAYDHKCAITGTNVDALLDAAHILPYKGTHTDRPDNGLLLRTDIHTLFDLYLLAIDAGHVVLSSTLDESEYTHLAGGAVSPATSGHEPSPTYLQQHLDEFKRRENARFE
ncbi:HNH endonuclease [Actinomycetota bacterium]